MKTLPIPLETLTILLETLKPCLKPSHPCLNPSQTCVRTPCPTQDLTKASWVDSRQNPIMGFPGPHAGPGNGSLPSDHLGGNDTTVMAGSILDEYHPTNWI